MIDSRDIKELHPILQVLTNEFLDIAKANNIACGVSSTYRDSEQQNYYYNVTKTTTVKAGYSYHQHRIAVDIVPLINGKLSWPEPKNYDWSKLGVIGEALGLEWGGRWSGFIDRPHYQMAFGLTCQQILNGTLIPQTIKKGCADRGLVKLVQKLVGVSIDGSFGAQTETAVKKYNPTGEVNAVTLKKLLDLSKPKPIPEPVLEQPKQPEVKMMDEFKDVPANHWSAAAMKHLHGLGLLNGYDENGQRVVGFGKPMETERVVQLLSNVIKHIEGAK